MAAARPRIEFVFWRLLVADEPGSGIPGSRYKEVWFVRESLQNTFLDEVELAQ